MVSVDMNSLRSEALDWGPRLAAAVIILLISWVIARIVRGLMGRALNGLPLLKSQSQGMEFQATFGARIGEVGYWLIMLIGIIAALTALQLTQVVRPLNSMMGNFLSYIPNVVGAGLIFFVGMIVANISQRVVTTGLQAANFDGLLARIGLGSESGTGLASAIGTLVFVLIITPVAIAALQALKIEAISAPAIVVLTTLLNAVPNVVAAGVVLTIGLLIGRWIGGVTERLLPATGVDRAFGSLQQLSSFTNSAEAAESGASASKVIGGIVTFAVVAFSAIEAARLIHFAAIAQIISQVLELAGRVILGGVIIAAGALIGDILANAIGRSVNEGEKFAGSLAKWATIALAVAMGLKSMGIADEIVMLAFGLILGAAAVAAALAFGLGARDAAGRLANQWVDKAQKK